MALTLKNFKRTIPSTILTRGRDYFQSGRVVDLSLDGDDRWEVEVQGSEPYHITIAPVSYTHLDVYKRQVSRSSSAS